MLITKKEDPQNFMKAKEIVAGVLNRHRSQAGLNAALIRIKQGTTPSPSPTPPPPLPPLPALPHQRSVSDPQQTRPTKQPRLEPNPTTTGGGGGHITKIRLPGMQRAFPPFFFEIYLVARGTKSPRNVTLNLMSAAFPEWVASVGGIEKADEFIGQLEILAQKNDASGGAPQHEKERRIAATIWFKNLDEAQRRAERLRFEGTASVTPSPNTSRRTSPEISRSITIPVEPPPVVVEEKKVCNKCAAESLECNGEDPCDQCISLGRYHLCTFPDPPPPPPAPPPSRPASVPQPRVVPSNDRPSSSPLQSRGSSRNGTSPALSQTSWQSRPSTAENRNPQPNPTHHQPPPPPHHPHTRTTTFPPHGLPTYTLEEAQEMARAGRRRDSNPGEARPPAPAYLQRGSPSNSPVVLPPVEPVTVRTRQSPVLASSTSALDRSSQLSRSVGSSTLTSSRSGGPRLPPPTREPLGLEQARHFAETAGPRTRDLQPLRRSLPNSMLGSPVDCAPDHNSPHSARYPQGATAWQPYSFLPPAPHTSRSPPHGSPPLAQRQYPIYPPPQHPQHSNPSNMQPRQNSQPQPPSNQRFQTPSWQNFLRNLPPHLDNLRSCIPFKAPSTGSTPGGSFN
ncbi:uncharacterized protein JCM6883_004311 [Sporobolomyces salmoneus]|uniref:uncharacterized protein n=1 Tax=Sporobolomyces salmoneus TaxID=183962 RepID=UPI003173E472